MYFQQDFLNKNKHWQGIPHLPNLEINAVKRAYHKYKDKLTSSEIDRNKLKNVYQFI